MRQLKITKSITNRESASLEKYLQEIGKEEMISAEEEVELAQRIKKGDAQALERLTKANLRFVVSVAKQYQNQGLTLPDLINEGNLGLLKAAERISSGVSYSNSQASPLLIEITPDSAARGTIRWDRSIRLTVRSASSNRRTSVGLPCMRLPIR